MVDIYKYVKSSGSDLGKKIKGKIKEKYQAYKEAKEKEARERKEEKEMYDLAYAKAKEKYVKKSAQRKARTIQQKAYEQARSKYYPKAGQKSGSSATLDALGNFLGGDESPKGKKTSYKEPDIFGFGTGKRSKRQDIGLGFEMTKHPKDIDMLGLGTGRKGKRKELNLFG
jgi:hypothetical protein